MRRFSTADILGWVAKERDYHWLIGYGRAKTLKAEIAFARVLLDAAEAACPEEGAPGDPMTTITNMRRIAANFVRALEYYGIPDQDMQKVRDCTVTIHREGE